MLIKPSGKSLCGTAALYKSRLAIVKQKRASIGFRTIARAGAAARR